MGRRARNGGVRDESGCRSGFPHPRLKVSPKVPKAQAPGGRPGLTFVPPLAKIDTLASLALPVLQHVLAVCPAPPSWMAGVQRSIRDSCNNWLLNPREMAPTRKRWCLPGMPELLLFTPAAHGGLGAPRLDRLEETLKLGLIGRILIPPTDPAAREHWAAAAVPLAEEFRHREHHGGHEAPANNWDLWTWVAWYEDRRKIRIGRIAGRWAVQQRTIRASKLFSRKAPERHPALNKLTELQTYLCWLSTVPRNAALLFTDGSFQQGQGGGAAAVLMTRDRTTAAAVRLPQARGNGDAELAALELAAATIKSARADGRLLPHQPVAICADSQYALGAAAGWTRIQFAHARVLALREALQVAKPVVLRYVPAHVDRIPGALVIPSIPGNQLADRLAEAARLGGPPDRGASRPHSQHKSFAAQSAPPSGPQAQPSPHCPSRTNSSHAHCSRPWQGWPTRRRRHATGWRVRTPTTHLNPSRPGSATPGGPGAASHSPRCASCVQPSARPSGGSIRSRPGSGGRGSALCPFGCGTVETQSHLLGGCRHFRLFYVKRHDQVLRALARALTAAGLKVVVHDSAANARKATQIPEELQARIPAHLRHLRPDLLVCPGEGGPETPTVIELAVTTAVRDEDLAKARDGKLAQYRGYCQAAGFDNRALLFGATGCIPGQSVRDLLQLVPGTEHKTLCEALRRISGDLTRSILALFLMRDSDRRDRASTQIHRPAAAPSGFLHPPLRHLHGSP
ncbi:hypothetical protein PAPYR_1628 [Paratrimastix pyriformis]|uniref:RNase H type-1 domain-containing protein n=1 Tax=Paratrimastix pyriformis TaxID=342808 RepID=A0ABQ8UU99_9EUKA|nr:hypothetical protein PAPYR_1628 [Paratrimastix pyriformis]